MSRQSSRDREAETTPLVPFKGERQIITANLLAARLTVLYGPS